MWRESGSCSRVHLQQWYNSSYLLSIYSVLNNKHLFRPHPVIGEVSSVLFSGNLSGKVAVSSKQECYVDQGRWRQWRAQVTSHSLLLSLRLTNQQFAQLPQPAPVDTGHSRNVKFLTVHIQFTPVKTTGLKCWWGGYGVNLFVWLGRSLVTKVEPSCSLLICDSAAWPRWIVKY